MYVQKMISMLAILALCGCAGVRPLNNDGARDELTGMYGLLDKSPSGYVFREFSEETKRGETWVSLANFKPTWAMSKSMCAGYGLLALPSLNNPPDEFTCMEEDAREKFFYARRHIDYTTPTGAFVGVLTIATSGVMAIIAVPSTDYFDTKRYEQAVRQAWNNSVESKGGIPFVLAEKERIQKEAEARKQAEEEQARVRAEQRRERERQHRLQEQKRREAMAQRIIASGVGTQVCNDYRNRFIRIGYIEGIENDRVKIAVADIRYERNRNMRPGGFQPNTIWDSPKHWYVCHFN